MPSPSLHQRRVLDFVRAGTGHALVRATAGAGKTTTLVQVAETLPSDLRICFLAFARDAARELRARLPEHVAAMTVHALGRRTLAAELRRRHLELTLDGGKVRRLVRAELRGLSASHGAGADDLAECGDYLADLIDFARLDLTDANDPEQVRRLSERYDLLPPGRSDLAVLMQQKLASALRRGAHQALKRGLVDYSDMLYLPQVLGLAGTYFDFVCIDEAQDYSALALEFTLRLVAGGGRLLFVGDPRQSIFGFAGADSDALGRIVRRCDATILPLTISYRCPKAHVALAQRLAPEIEAAPNAASGSVHWIPDSALEAWAREGDLIVCRTNAPLVAACLRLLRAGHRASVWGRDLERQLLAVAERAFASGYDRHRRRLDHLRAAERTRIGRAPMGKAAAQRLLARQFDLIDSLAYLLDDLAASAVPTPERLRALLAYTFGARGAAGVALATVHRAKGREAERVLILHPELLEAAPAAGTEARRAEACVQFVALTRAKEELVFVAMPEADDRGTGGRGDETGGSPREGEPRGRRRCGLLRRRRRA